MTEEERRAQLADLERRRIAILRKGDGSMTAGDIGDYQKLLEEEATIREMSTFGVATGRSPAVILAEMREKGVSDRRTAEYMNAQAEEARVHGAEIIHVSSPKKRP